MLINEQEYFDLKKQVEDLTNERDYYKQKYEEFVTQRIKELQQTISDLEWKNQNYYIRAMVRNPEDAYREDFSI